MDKSVFLDSIIIFFSFVDKVPRWGSIFMSLRFVSQEIVEDRNAKKLFLSRFVGVAIPS